MMLSGNKFGEILVKFVYLIIAERDLVVTSIFSITFTPFKN